MIGVFKIATGLMHCQDSCARGEAARIETCVLKQPLAAGNVWPPASRDDALNRQSTATTSCSKTDGRPPSSKGPNNDNNDDKDDPLEEPKTCFSDLRLAHRASPL